MATSDDLIARLDKSRALRVPVGDGVEITALRPTALDVMEMRNLRGYLEFATGWSGVTESLIFGEGSSDPVPFSKALWMAVAADRIGWVNEFVEALTEARKAHEKTLEAVRKN